MSRRAIASIVCAALAVAASWSAPAVPPVRAAEYSLESTVTYEVLPDQHAIAVTVAMTFTNTTPDPAGKFSVFDEVRLAIHDAARSVAANDPEGELEVSVADEDGVNVATVALREDLRFEKSVDLELTYRLEDGIDPRIRVGPSLVAFPAWGFGTSSRVDVAIPAGFEVRVDGDTLSETPGGGLTSGPIEDPGSWLALLVAVGPVDPVSFEATVPLRGGTADLEVRAFADDRAWGEAARDLAVEALPLIEEAVGLPYPLLGRLVVTQGVPGDTGPFGDPVTPASGIVVAYDEPQFTLLHQLVHVWLPSSLVESHWIGEGLASDVAARVAAELDVPVPFDPEAEARARAGAAIPLASWTPASNAEVDRFGHAAAWAFMAELRSRAGDETIRTVLLRTASSIGPYQDARISEPPPPGSSPRVPLTSRTLLDLLETVSGLDLAPRFAEVVLVPADVALLGARASAREQFAALVEDAGSWGAPDAVRASMAGWKFDEAVADMDAARAWLSDRDALHADMQVLGLSSPDRLQQAYRAYGGGPEAVDELAALRAVVDAYSATAARVNAPRSFLARIGLLGSTDPAAQLALASGHFADGDLAAARVSLDEADRIMSGAESGGLVRLVSLVLLLAVLVALAVTLFRRRASYTGRP